MSDLLSRNTLVINQKAKLVELTNEYRILDEEGNEVGSIRQEGQSKARKALRFLTSVDQFLTHKLPAPVPPDLRLMMLGSAAGVDVALKQDDSGGIGFGGWT